jgi:hypothetical protein
MVERGDSKEHTIKVSHFAVNSEDMVI